MSFQIICPYCFNEENDGKPFSDDEVMFRSERVSKGEPDFLPDEYDSIEEFSARYRGENKEAILEQYAEWAFFREGEDPVYTKWWDKYDGTTETTPADAVFKVKAYHRKIIDPRNAEHRKYLKERADGDYFVRDEQGMVAAITLKEGGTCNRRVCPFCHNPLPDNYGKNPVKFAAVIGITGAGKTVYLYQLLNDMQRYAAKVGMSANVTNASSLMFRENNTVAANMPLPGSTPVKKLQQPLFYELVRNENGRRKVDTFVMYDVAGEVFQEGNQELLQNFAPFIRHADCAIVLIDPMQFDVIVGAAREGRRLADPVTALETIHSTIFGKQRTNDLCEIPFAICLAKADREEVQNVLSDTLRGKLVEDVKPVQDSHGYNRPIFNAEDYAPIGKELGRFVKNNEYVLAQMMRNNYASYAYFAFTALGCDVEEGKMQNGEKYQYPVGPVLPKRIEEPLLWMFYKLGYIGKNGPLPGEYVCPNPDCRSVKTMELPEDQRTIVEYHGFWLWKRAIEYQVNRRCLNCGQRWLQEEE